MPARERDFKTSRLGCSQVANRRHQAEVATVRRFEFTLGCVRCHSGPIASRRPMLCGHDPRLFSISSPRAKQRASYFGKSRRSVRRAGHVIVSTFPPRTQKAQPNAAGLDVVRYDSESLRRFFGTRFPLVESSKEFASTPFGTTTPMPLLSNWQRPKQMNSSNALL